jgi:ABC-2 type transport system ATP-binding protein
MALVEVQSLVKQYGRLRILDCISFTLERGIHGLIGPNGAGKTTTLKVLLGLTTADEGIVKVFGLDVSKESSRVLERVGVLHENPRLPSWATGSQFLRYVASLKLRSSGEQILTVAKMADIDYALDRTIGTYSAGMVQRIGFAAALIGSPELVFLDEPTANLDPLGRIDVWNKIMELHKEQGVSFLISTHALFELEKVCQTVVILHGGKVLDRGTVEELTKKYSVHEYVLRVDHPSLLRDRLEESGAVRRLERRGNEIVVSVNNREVFFQELSQLVRNNEFQLMDVESSKFTLEDIFVEAFRRRVKE